MIRDTGETHHDSFGMESQLMEEGFEYGKDYAVVNVPNIVNITYGRDVGYTIEQETLDPDIEAISATRIREQA